MRLSKPGYENSYWCCAADFGRHELDCPNTPSLIKYPQLPTDFSNFEVGEYNNITPHDLDYLVYVGPVAGRIHRRIKGLDVDYFLTIEVKRAGDRNMTEGQEQSLRAESRRLNSVVILANSSRIITPMNCYLFVPTSYVVYMADGTDVGKNTSIENFKQRLDRFAKVPDLLTQHFTEDK